MNGTRQQREEHTFQNWHQVAVGISMTTHGVADHLRDTLINLHTEIKTGPCETRKDCTRNCSKHESDLMMWCPTCTEWKHQILIHRRCNAKPVKWNQIDSAKWPVSPDEMVKVYAPKWWRGTPHYTEDLAISIPILHNCTEFAIPTNIFQDVRDVRNGRFAHGRLQVSSADKNKALKILIHLLKQPEIIKTPSGRKALAFMAHHIQFSHRLW